MNNQRITDDPQLVGFDMPGAASPADAQTTLVALLDVAPGVRWQKLFANRTAGSAANWQIDQIRLIGKHITLVGLSGKLRMLAPAIQDLVAEVSRACLQQRVETASSADRPGPRGTFDAPARDDGPVMVPVRKAEVELVSSIDGIQDLLAEVADITRMRFSAISRVTDTRWTTCAVHDLLSFGLLPGQDLILETTICNELRSNQQTVAFNNASTHQRFSKHHTPLIYGFESYISVPIILRDGSMFGTLCALDPEPAHLDQAAISRVEALASLVARSLDTETPLPMLIGNAS